MCLNLIFRLLRELIFSLYHLINQNILVKSSGLPTGNHLFFIKLQINRLCGERWVIFEFFTIPDKASVIPSASCDSPIAFCMDQQVIFPVKINIFPINIIISQAVRCHFVPWDNKMLQRNFFPSQLPSKST